MQLNFTEETLTFTDITGTVANRGFLQTQIFLGGVAYLQTINDNFDNTGQRRPGVWANVPATTNPVEQATVVRMGSIPHGTTVNMQGRAFVVTTPQFEKSSIAFRSAATMTGKPSSSFPDEQDLSSTTDARTDLRASPRLIRPTWTIQTCSCPTLSPVRRSPTRLSWWCRPT